MGVIERGGDPRRRTLLLAASLTTLALALNAWAPDGGAPLDAASLPRWPQFAVLTVAFGLGEQLLMHIEFRREAHSFTLAGVPLVLALLMAPLPDVLVARVVGAGLALVVQHISFDKIVYNCSAWAFEAALDAFLVGGLVGHRSQLDVTSAAVLLLVVAAVDQVMSSLVLLVIRMHGAAVSPREIGEVLGSALVLSCVSTSTAIGMSMLARMGFLGCLVVAVCVCVSLVLYRGYVAATRRHQRLELLHEFVSVGVGAQSLEEVAHELLPKIRSALRAQYATLAVYDGGAPAWAASRDDVELGVRRFTVDESDRVIDERDRVDCDRVSTRALEHNEPFLAPRGSKDPATRQWLEQNSHRDAIVVPLSAGSPLRGTVTVSDRFGETATFTQDDVTLLQTLTGHVAVASRSARLVERLAYEATHDPLTGLANRGFLTQQIHSAPPETDEVGCVLLLDLDRFKEVNDGLGHSAGDALLVAMAERLRHALPAEATVARLGGDEFAAYVPHVAGGEVDAHELCVRLAAQLVEPVLIESALITPDLSIGVAVTGDECARDDLLRRADTAMYAAKSSDVSVAMFDPAMDQGRLENLALLAELRDTLRNHPHQIQVYYQPKIDLRDHRVVSAEALVRWNHPRLGVLSPDRFVPLAETAGLIDQFAPLVLHSALAECRRWHDRGHPLTVAVNLSARNLGDPTLPERAARALSQAGLDPEHLILEVTESSVIADPVQTLGVMDELAKGGVTISLDDFGTGYSSLSYLQRLPVRELKIDRSFVTGLASPDRYASRTLISAIAGLGHNLGLRVVAEGVESAHVLAELRALGCDIAQGYLISRPLPAARFLEWLDEAVPGAVTPVAVEPTGQRQSRRSGGPRLHTQRPTGPLRAIGPAPRER